MKRLILPLLGLIPFPLGWLINWLMTNVSIRGLGWYSVVMLAIWFFLSYRFSRFNKNTAEAVLLLNLPAAMALILLVVQLLFFHSYWMNAAGLWPQIFYLPLIFLAAWLGVWTSSTLIIYCISFILLVAVSILGCIVYKRHIYYKKYH